MFLCVIVLSNNKDNPVWKCRKNAQFTVKFMCNFCCSNGNDRSRPHLWKAKIPMKIKVAILDASFVIGRKNSSPFFSNVQLPNMCKDVLAKLLGLLIARAIFLILSNVFLVCFILIKMFVLLASL
jgi:hypothetical protein